MYLKPSKRILRQLHSGIDCSFGPHADEPCIVFAPHPDDEVLGCGGTMILKRKLGTPVTVVFMTDGRTSHQKFKSADELCRIRREEAIDAGRAMGIDARDLRFMDFPDGQLGEHEERAVAEVGSLLSEVSATEVFVPFCFDRTPDHEATFRIVRDAICSAGSGLHVFEYPVWAWNQWPWVSLDLKPNRALLRNLRELWRSRFGLAILREFRSGVTVGEVLSQKRVALAQHRSQTIELQPGVGWPTLESVSHGEFLSCFFQNFEVFRCSVDTSPS